MTVRRTLPCGLVVALQHLLSIMSASSSLPRPAGLHESSTPLAAGQGRLLAALLLAAAIAALAVAAERLMASWSDEHLLATWLGLWAVVFAGSLLLAGTARRTAQRVIGQLDAWARRRAVARAHVRTQRLIQLRAVTGAPMAPQPHGASAAASSTPSPWHGMTTMQWRGYVRAMTYYV